MADEKKSLESSMTFFEGFMYVGARVVAFVAVVFAARYANMLFDHLHNSSGSKKLPKAGVTIE